MTQSTLKILSKIEAKNPEEIKVDEPYGIIQDATYSYEYYLVEWPDDTEDIEQETTDE